MMTADRKPARKVTPTIRHIEGSVFEIAAGRAVGRYCIERIPCEFGVAAFSVAQLTVEREAELYHVHVERPGVVTCSCAGGTYVGRCKHSQGVSQMWDAGHFNDGPDREYDAHETDGPTPEDLGM